LNDVANEAEEAAAERGQPDEADRTGKTRAHLEAADGGRIRDVTGCDTGGRGGVSTGTERRERTEKK
jgi:hypothetical protein